MDFDLQIGTAALGYVPMEQGFAEGLDFVALAVDTEQAAVTKFAELVRIRARFVEVAHPSKMSAKQITKPKDSLEVTIGLMISLFASDFLAYSSFTPSTDQLKDSSFAKTLLGIAAEFAVVEQFMVSVMEEFPTSPRDSLGVACPSFIP